MKNLKNAYRKTFQKALNPLFLYYFIMEKIIKIKTNQKFLIFRKNIKIQLFIPNRLNIFRAQTFSTKEPETLEWIDSLSDGCTVYDIGANVGLYTIYAAKKKASFVVAFEPSVFNLELLAKNLHLNGLTDRVTIFPLPLTKKISNNVLRMSNTEWGGAFSAFGQKTGWDGKPICSKFEFRTLGISLDEAVKIFKLPKPDYLKIDVDGIEHAILHGGAGVLKKIKGVLIEINDDFKDQALQCNYFLKKAGLRFLGKSHGSQMDGTPFQSCYNQIWVRH